jgi:hypothetical protein
LEARLQKDVLKVVTLGRIDIPYQRGLVPSNAPLLPRQGFGLGSLVMRCNRNAGVQNIVDTSYLSSIRRRLKSGGAG